MKDRIIFCYGCPRSGTTYLRHLLSQSDSNVVKIPEWSMLHPCNSDNGLLELVRMFKVNIDIVRIYRDPIDVAKSFYAARQVEEEKLEEVIESRSADVKAFAQHSNGYILTMLRDEAESTRLQNHDPVKIINIDYANIDIAKLSSLFGQDLIKFHEENWNKKPMRGGKLSYGLSPEIPSDFAELLNYIDNSNIK